VRRRRRKENGGERDEAPYLGSIALIPTLISSFIPIFSLERGGQVERRLERSERAVRAGRGEQLVKLALVEELDTRLGLLDQRSLGELDRVSGDVVADRLDRERLALGRDVSLDVLEAVSIPPTHVWRRRIIADAASSFEAMALPLHPHCVLAPLDPALASRTRGALRQPLRGDLVEGALADEGREMDGQIRRSPLRAPSGSRRTIAA
jgi:hypothetical protein